METWQDIKDFFFPAVQDTEASQSFFTTDQAVAWANGALWEMAQYAQYIDAVQTQNTVSGTASYYIGSTGLPPFGVWRVEIDDEKISAIDTRELRKNDFRWSTRSGRPYFYYMDEISPNPDYLRIGLVDNPNGVYELRTYAYGVPAQVAEGSDTDSVQVPQWAIYGVLWYMLSEAFMTEGRRQNLATSNFYRMLYDDTLERLRARTNRKTPKSWVVSGHSGYKGQGFWDNLPDTIPEPT